MNIRRLGALLVGVVILDGSAMVVVAAADDAGAAGNAIAPGAQMSSSAPAGGAPGDDKWRFTVPIGFYYFSMSGPVGIGDFTRDIDLSAGDVKDHTDRAAGLALNFGKGKWTGLASVVYLKLVGDDRSGELPSGTPITVEPSLEWTTAQAGAAYRAVLINPGPKMFVFEPLAGIRHTKLKTTIDVKTPPEAGSASTDVNWEDLFIGFRLTQSFTTHLGLKLDGDYGWAVSGNTDPSWNTSLSVGWRFPFDTWSLTAALGYKAGKVKYENSDENPLHMDVTMKGPTIGVAFSW